MSKRRPDTFRDHLARIRDHGHRNDEIFRAFARLIACAVASGTRETQYLEEIKRWEPENVQHFIHAFAALTEEMERKPYEDVLGAYYLEEASSKSGQKWSGEFYTPPEICKLMARMVYGTGEEAPKHRPITLLEPCCGAGGMVLAFAEAMKEGGVSPLDLRATCVDVSPVACDMCFFNLTMWGIPATVIHGNSITLESWGAWRNLWWFTPQVGTILHAVQQLEEQPNAFEIEPNAFEIENALIAARQTKSGQFIFDLEEAS